MQSRGEVQCIAGLGLAGDRYALGLGHYSERPGVERQVTVIEAETLDWLGTQHGIDLPPHECRRNLVVAGLHPLAELVDENLGIGEVLLRVVRVSEPCRYLEELVEKRLLDPLLHRGGVNCEIVRGGVVRPGDAVQVMAGAA